MVDEQVGEVELAEEELALIVEVGELLFIHLRYPFRTNFLTWMRQEEDYYCW